MAEEIPDEEWQSSHDLGFDIFFLDTYRLLCQFLASKPLSSLKEEKIGRGLGRGYERQEISSLLIKIATFYRVKYDDGSWEHAEWLHDEYNGVGELIKDVTLPESCELSFKEACNKIIHATKVHFDVETNPDTGIPYLNPVLYLYV